MKKLSSLLTGLFMLVLSFNANAQTSPADYFAGKWDVLIEGLPHGDPRMIVSLQRRDGKLEGAIMDSTQKEITQITKVDETEKGITVYFTAQGYDVNLDMTRQDDDHITANLMGMFDAKGVRIKEH
jgi:hypothetical protein